MDRKSKFLHGWVVFFALILIFGCAEKQVQPVTDAAPPPLPFPPQKAMQTGDYEGFFTENSEALKSCRDPDQCAAALFNLSFLHIYPKSPYYDPRLGIKYIDDLIAAVPESQWAFQARVWKDMIEKNMRKKTRKRPAREDPAKQTQESTDVVSQDRDWEAERQRMADQIKYKDEIIDKLNRQLERSRQIDIEMEEKERGLFR